MVNVIQRIEASLEQRRLERLVRPYTLVGTERIRNLCRLSRDVEMHQTPGDFVECGVYNGGTGAILGYFSTRSKLNRNLWLFDSFAGLPPSTGRDGGDATKDVGQLVGSVETVRQVLTRVKADPQRVQIVKGWFHETFPTVSIPCIALLNIDADWYESVKLCLERFYDSIVPGGFISIDDYGHWPGCKQAVDEFLTSRGIHPQLHRVDYTARWFQKR